MIIFDHGYSSEVDGKGTRLIFYLKGCNFRCNWCGAPESISPQPETLRYTNRTVTAGSCVTTQWVIDKALRSRAMIDGVTFGGGEPTLQADDLSTILKVLQENNIHTAMESNASTDAYREVTIYVDQLFSDLKTLSPELFAARINPDTNLLTKTLQNLQFAALNHPDLTIRVPVISQLNDSEAEQQKIADFLSKLKKSGGRFKVELLRQHHIAEPKYQALNRIYPCKDHNLPDEQNMENFKNILIKYQLEVI